MLRVFVIAFALVAGCAGIKTPILDGQPDSGQTDAAPTGGAKDTGTSADHPALDQQMREVNAVPVGCGTGRIDPGEVCDDGNSRGGDGCAADCTAVEKDFSCPEPGKACVYLVKCGDGVVAGNERCDPPHVGAGCSATCMLEPGYVCDPSPATPDPNHPADCRKTVCGDGTKEGTEACDDTNAVDGDGCSRACAFEPDCSTGTRASRCGDGIKLAPEDCDDGNAKDGDGCSSACAIEKGFTCTDAKMNPAMALNLLVKYRDFISLPTGTGVRHPDFEIFVGAGSTPLLVKPLLGTTGLPVLDGRCGQPGVTAQCPYDQQVTTAANFDQWYRDTTGVNIPITSALLLPRTTNGSYVYDSGADGFYPIDGKGWVATSPPKEVVTNADATVNDGKPHNFGYTTELRYFFQYRGGETLAFSGDDDLWIFLNRHLALDLGGLHTRLQGTLNVDQNAATLGLVVGGLYEMVLFHAERHSTGSNFKLTLTGFVPTSTTCQSACGDGMLAAPAEQCDDGNTVDGDGCSHDCRFEIVIP